MIMIILSLGIIFFFVIQRATCLINVKSCEVLVNPSESDLSIKVKYGTYGHMRTNFYFFSPLKQLAYVQPSCLSNCSSDVLTLTGCHQLDDFGKYLVNIIYERSNELEAEFTLSNSFDFRESGEYFESNVIEAYAYNGSSWGTPANCSSFYSSGRLTSTNNSVYI